MALLLFSLSTSVYAEPDPNCPTMYPISEGYPNGSWGFGVPTPYQALHTGEDFMWPAGTPIYAQGNGVVTWASWWPGNFEIYEAKGLGHGPTVWIHHDECGDGQISSLTAHMSNIQVSVGDKVTQGQLIGYIGPDGVSGAGENPHTHAAHSTCADPTLGDRCGGTWVNPNNFWNGSTPIYQPSENTGGGQSEGGQSFGGNTSNTSDQNAGGGVMEIPINKSTVNLMTPDFEPIYFSDTIESPPEHQVENIFMISLFGKWEVKLNLSKLLVFWDKVLAFFSDESPQDQTLETSLYVVDVDLSKLALEPWETVVPMVDEPVLNANDTVVASNPKTPELSEDVRSIVNMEAYRIISDGASLVPGCPTNLVYAIWRYETGVVDCQPYRDNPNKNPCRSGSDALGGHQFLQGTWDMHYRKAETLGIDPESLDIWDLHDSTIVSCIMTGPSSRFGSTSLNLWNKTDLLSFQNRFTGQDGGYVWNKGFPGSGEYDGWLQSEDIFLLWQQVNNSTP